MNQKQQIKNLLDPYVGDTADYFLPDLDEKYTADQFPSLVYNKFKVTMPNKVWIALKQFPKDEVLKLLADEYFHDFQE